MLSFWHCSFCRSDGVSRNHVEILRINKSDVVIKVCDRVKNPIAIKYGTQELKYGAGKIAALEEGDILVLDTYRKCPRHLFEIVSVISTPLDQQ